MVNLPSTDEKNPFVWSCWEQFYGSIGETINIQALVKIKLHDTDEDKFNLVKLSWWEKSKTRWRSMRRLKVSLPRWEKFYDGVKWQSGNRTWHIYLLFIDRKLQKYVQSLTEIMSAFHLISSSFRTTQYNWDCSPWSFVEEHFKSSWKFFFAFRRLVFSWSELSWGPTIS